jgi:hypothetical protein
MHPSRRDPHDDILAVNRAYNNSDFYLIGELARGPDVTFAIGFRDGGTETCPPEGGFYNFKTAHPRMTILIGS